MKINKKAAVLSVSRAPVSKLHAISISNEMPASDKSAELSSLRKAVDSATKQGKPVSLIAVFE